MRFRIVQVPIQDSSDECFIWYIFHYFECKSLDSFYPVIKAAILYFLKTKKVDLSVDILYSQQTCNSQQYVYFVFLLHSFF